MASESARATAATEFRYRVRTPNSRPRSVMVVPLDEPAAQLAADLSAMAWRGVTFLTMPLTAVPPGSSAEVGGAESSFSTWLHAVTGQAIDVAGERARVDVVQMLSTAGHDASAASLIGDAALLRNVKTSGLIIDDHQSNGEELTRSLLALRPWVMTLSVLGSAEYVDDILHALGG